MIEIFTTTEPIIFLTLARLHLIGIFCAIRSGFGMCVSARLVPRLSSLMATKSVWHICLSRVFGNFSLSVMAICQQQTFRPKKPRARVCVCLHLDFGVSFGLMGVCSVPFGVLEPNLTEWRNSALDIFNYGRLVGIWQEQSFNTRSFKCVFHLFFYSNYQMRTNLGTNLCNQWKTKWCLCSQIDTSISHYPLPQYIIMGWRISQWYKQDGMWWWWRYVLVIVCATLSIQVNVLLRFKEIWPKRFSNARTRKFITGNA